MPITKQIIRAFLLAYWYWIAAGLLALGLIVYAIGAVGSCRQASWQKKVERTKDGIIANKAEANLLANQSVNQRIEVNAAAVNSNAAVNAVNAVRNANYSGTKGSDLDKKAANYGR